jgi:hypothetical protein
MVVSFKRRPPFTNRKIPGTHFPRAKVLLEGLDKLKNPNDLSSSRIEAGPFRLAAQCYIYILLCFKAIYSSPHFRWVRLQQKNVICVMWTFSLHEVSTYGISILGNVFKMREGEQK